MEWQRGYADGLGRVINGGKINISLKNAAGKSMIEVKANKNMHMIRSMIKTEDLLDQWENWRKRRERRIVIFYEYRWFKGDYFIDKNWYCDKQQYQRYKETFGDEAPKSFDNFQDIKYNNTDEYNILKAQVKGMTYYDKAVDNEPLITSVAKEIAKNNQVDMIVLIVEPQHVLILMMSLLKVRKELIEMQKVRRSM